MTLSRPTYTVRLGDKRPYLIGATLERAADAVATIPDTTLEREDGHKCGKHERAAILAAKTPGKDLWGWLGKRDANLRAAGVRKPLMTAPDDMGMPDQHG